MCRRRAPSRAPRAAWQPATAPGVRSFLTTSQVPELIWELFISCQKTALPAKKTTLAAERPRAWYEGSPGLNHKAPAVWLESKAGRARGGAGSPCHMVALKSQGGSEEGFLRRSRGVWEKLIDFNDRFPGTAAAADGRELQG